MEFSDAKHVEAAMALQGTELGGRSLMLDYTGKNAKFAAPKGDDSKFFKLLCWVSSSLAQGKKNPCFWSSDIHNVEDLFTLT